MTHWVLIDTCVWLDLAKDHRELPIINALGELVLIGTIRLIVPEIVTTEFTRNRERVADEARTAFKTHIRLARDAVARYGPDANKAATLAALSDVDHEIHNRGDSVSGTMKMIEQLLDSAVTYPATEEIKRRVVDRALAQVAPYHRAKNSVGDAIILETYIAHMATHSETTERFTFVTHNIKDFSEQNGDRRLPHPDLAGLFDGTRSSYATSLAELLREIDPDVLDDLDFELNFQQDPRRLTEILEAEHLLFRQIWYNRHWNLRIKIQDGEHFVVPDAEYSRAC